MQVINTSQPEIHELRSAIIIFLLGTPVTVLVLSYLYLAVEYQTLFLFNLKVHESGKYTLLQTMFYFDHFAREIPIGALNALSISISFYILSPLAGISRHSFRKFFIPAAYSLLFFLLIVVAAAIHKNGFGSFLLDLLQFRTRDDLVSYGSHWHSHLLDMFFVMLFSLALSFIYRGITGTPNRTIDRRGLHLLFVWGALFIACTVIFVPTIKPLSDTRFLAHQFREIATHSVTTVPLAYAFLILLERSLSGNAISIRRDRQLIKRGMLFIIAASAIPLFIAGSLVGRDIIAEAQKKTSYLNLLAAHYFEHMLDYFFVSTLSMAFYVSFLFKSNKTPGMPRKTPDSA